MSIKTNLEQVRERIALAAARAGRAPSEITLVAVSKTKPPEMVREAVAAGATILGENRVQEAESKIAELRDLPAVWHLIGHLQTNKANKAVLLFDLIHSVDSPRLVEAINRAAQSIGKRQAILLQVNIAGEEQKFGIPPGEFEHLLDYALAVPAVEVKGLMVMPPFSENPEEARPYFRALRDLAARYTNELGNRPELSMGMTGDFEVAIEEGSTMVRIGTAIFGAR
ncbi:MAG TPA: YggS family pyridoxal phosphate-dependent enzyme [bacterium]|nr:YggS family pyridoxal phosphate-dependent enzyme [bacterium]HQL63957.1 YggS family pyridoxal phosphate-dependent enzyme [bacterium]